MYVCFADEFYCGAGWIHLGVSFCFMPNCLPLNTMRASEEICRKGHKERRNLQISGNIQKRDFS